jgi:chromosome segregation ATPase
MTDMSGTSNVSGTSRSSTRSKLSPIFKELVGAARKLVGHEKEIGDFDQILDEKKELEINLKSKEEEITKLRSTKDSEIASHRLAKEKEIETLQSTKDAEIAKLKTAKDTLFEEFQTQFKTWNIETTKQEELKRKIDGLSGELSEANRRANSFEEKNALLQRQLEERQDAVVEVENKLKTVRGLLGSKERELTGTVKALEDCQSMLDEERRELGLEYPDHEDLSVNNYLM